MSLSRTAFVGAADHAGWAVLVTVSADGVLLDRRRVDLLDDSLPRMPYHHEAQSLSLDEAEHLIASVRASAEERAEACLARLAAEVARDVGGIALRECPSLPATVAERITDYRAQCVADTVLYRRAMAKAAGARGWTVAWYDPRHVFAAAARALPECDVDDLIAGIGATHGPPWRKDHRIAMAAAIAASRVRA